MPSATMGDLLDRGREFEIRMEAFYARVRDTSANNGVRMLTYYLALRRRHLDQALAECDKAHVRRLRAAKITPADGVDPTRLFTLPRTSPRKASGPELLEAALARGRALLEFCAGLRERIRSEGGRMALDALVRAQERDLAMMKKMVAMNYFG